MIIMKMAYLTVTISHKVRYKTKKMPQGTYLSKNEDNVWFKS